MRFHVGRDEQQLGQYSKDQLAEGLRNDTFYPSDLVWQEGMSSWLPLEKVLPEILPGQTPPDLNSVEASPKNIPPTTSGEVVRRASPLAYALAVATLIISLLSFYIIFSVISFHSYWPVVSITGVILGHRAIKEVKKSQGKLGETSVAGTAAIGLFFSYIPLIFLVINFILTQTLSEEAYNELLEKIFTIMTEMNKISSESDSFY